jgi:subtilisin family serine protease
VLPTSRLLTSLGLLAAVLALATSPLALATSPAQIAPVSPRGPEARLRVVLGAVGDPHELASEVSSLGGEVRLVTTLASQAVVATLERRQLPALAADPKVSSITNLGAPLAWAEALDPDLAETTGPVVYLVDQPVDPGHPWLSDSIVRTGYLRSASPLSSCGTHGTDVAGVLVGRRGTVSDVVVVSLGVGCPRGDLEALLGAFEWVARHHRPGTTAVMNLSLTSPSVPAINDAVSELHRRGVLSIWSAGNDGATSCRGVAAEVEQAVVVGSLGLTGRTSSFSNRGPCVDLYALGEFVPAPSAPWAPDWLPRVVFGTSFSAPKVTARAAQLLAADPGLSPDELSLRLLAPADLPDPVRRAAGGSGAASSVRGVAQRGPPAPSR